MGFKNIALLSSEIPSEGFLLDEKNLRYLVGVFEDRMKMLEGEITEIEDNFFARNRASHHIPGLYENHRTILRENYIHELTKMDALLESLRTDPSKKEEDLEETERKTLEETPHLNKSNDEHKLEEVLEEVEDLGEVIFRVDGRFLTVYAKCFHCRKCTEEKEIENKNRTDILNETGQFLKREGYQVTEVKEERVWVCPDCFALFHEEKEG